jgi:hypothetical protein
MLVSNQHVKTKIMGSLILTCPCYWTFLYIKREAGFIYLINKNIQNLRATITSWKQSGDSIVNSERILLELFFEFVFSPGKVGNLFGSLIPL